MVAFLVYLLVLVLISLLNFWLYASDKMRAKNNLWRIPEKLLLAVGFFGGAIGGAAPQYGKTVCKGGEHCLQIFPRRFG